MKTIKIVSFLFLIIFPRFLSAQKEASVWLVSPGRQINFQSGSFELSEFSAKQNVKASICDENGNLVFYTDGRTVWNKFHEIVKNGERLIPDEKFQQNKPVFVPFPQKKGWYILFYEEDDYKIIAGKYNNSLYYAELNSNANGGKGEVVNQKIKIHDNFHSGPIVAGFCDNSYYWLINDRNDNTQIAEDIDRIYSYKIDENGVNKVPVISQDIDIGSSGNYLFSPNGDKIYFLKGSSNMSGPDVIADFNFKTGRLYNYRQLSLNLDWVREFSSDSRLFYYTSGRYLLQADVSFFSGSRIYSSIDTILTLPVSQNHEFPWQGMKLAPDGKIYLYYFDAITNKYKLGRINNPNLKGLACNTETDVLDIGFADFSFPPFVSSFFREKSPVVIDEVFPDAGPYAVICSNSKIFLGTNNDNSDVYQWFPEIYIADPFKSKTLLSPEKFVGLPKTYNYTLKATDGNCWLNFDSTRVTINPVPSDLLIDGSWSVCPFVERVDYWTEANNDPLKWLVDGGEIVTDSTAKSVKINWFETNSKASVSVFSQNQYKCFSDTSVFPVRINVELITETPKGPEKICVADSRNVEYQIRKTNGSVYEWIADGGKIIKGNGTNSVSVEWFGEGLHTISVEETSTTIDTVCFGESMPLQVEVFNDSLEIELTNVSYTPDEILRFSYSSQRFDWNRHDLYLVVDDESGDFESTINLTGNDDTFFYMPISVLKKPEIFRLKVVNSCGEAFVSNPQQIIIVEGKENLSENTIDLNWNINKYWEGNDLEHEIWCLDEENGDWKLAGKTGNDNRFSFPLEGLSHIFHFRIYEFNKTKNSGSWSNKIKVEVEGQLIIPDVFTPNGDGINDTWEIANIRFHQITKLVVFDRYGKKVFECTDNYIPWEGRINGEVRQGTYLYQAWFIDGTKLNGQITVLQ